MSARPPPLIPSRLVLPSSPTLASLTTVRNARDLAEAWPAIAPGRLYRSACPAGAAEADVRALRQGLRVSRLLDLRSDTERRDDPRCLLLHAEDAVTTSFVREGDRAPDPSGRHLAAAQAAPGPLPADAPAPPHAGEPPLTITHVSLLDKRRFYRSLLTSMPRADAARVALWRLVSSRRSRSAAMAAINARGLGGLYACMLDSSGPRVCDRVACGVRRCRRPRPTPLLLPRGERQDPASSPQPSSPWRAPQTPSLRMITCGRMAR